MALRHIVMWKLASEDAAQRAEENAEIARRLEGLVGAIPEILSMKVFSNTAYTETNADAVLVSDFASTEALERYMVHPAHQEVASYIRSVVAGGMAIDYEV